MTRIYVVRHCEAIGNIKHIFQGVTDLDITPLGEKQLQCVTKRFADIEIDRVYSSPLIRTQKTAKAIIGSRDIPLIINEGLIELNGGFIEGKPFSETFGVIPELLEVWENHPQDFAPDGGEKMTHAYDRIWNTVKAIAQENKGKTVACASHGGVIRCLNCRLFKNDIRELKNIPWADNTAVTLIELDEQLNPTAVFVNDTSHIPESLHNNKSSIADFAKDMEK